MPNADGYALMSAILGWPAFQMNQAVQRQASTGAPERCSWWPYIVPQRAVRLYTTSTTTRAVETTPEHYVYVFSPAPTIFAAHCELRLLLEKRRMTRRRMFLLLHGWRWLIFTMDILDVAHFEERVKSSWPLMRLWLSPRPWGLQLLAFLLTRSPQRADL